MAGELKAGFTPGRNVYFIGFVGSEVLKVTTLTLGAYSAGDYANYDIAATEQGSTGIYVADMPSGAPAGRYDFFVYERIGASPAVGDPFAAGAFTLYWNGSSVSDDPGDDVDADVALVTLTEAKQYLNVSGAEEDAIIASLINSVSTWVQSFLNRNLVRDTFTEYYSGDGTKELVLNSQPIVSITSIHVDSLREFDADTLISSDNYIIEKEPGIVRAWDLLNDWQSGYANIKVVSVRGYTAGPAGTMPHDIKLAVYRIMDHHYRTGYTHRKLDVSSETLGDQTTTFRDGDIPADAKSILEPYRKHFPSPQFVYAD